MSFLFRFHDIIGGIHVPVDDGVDKLNRKYTLLVFLFLALPIFTKQYIGDPIECFAPVYFAEHQSRYINSYCWTQSTYYMVPVGDPEDDGDQQEPPDRIMPDEVDYFIGFETVTHIGNERLRRVRVSYYQWAPLILLVQGLCFYIPFLIWNSCANNAGVKLRRLLKKASDIASLPPGCQQREALLAEFVDQFHTLVTGEAGWCADLQCNPTSLGAVGASGSGGHNSAGSNASSLSSGSGSVAGQAANVRGGSGRANQQQGGNHEPDHHHQERHHNSNSNNRNSNHNQDLNPGCCLVSIPIIGSLLACCLKPCATFGLVGPSKYLCLLYLAVKFAYVFNVGLQFYLLSTFLGRGYLKHGLELINRLIVNGDWWNSPRFPLSTLCQVRADMSGGLRSYTCQCVLPINVFNEKIFSVVWFYMAFLMPLNVLSLLFWIYRTFESNRLSYIRLCLWRTRLVELNQIHRTVRKLSQSYLGWDGVFLLRLIEHNHGSIMATLIMSRLWEFYANQMKLQEDANMIAMANNAQHTLSNTTTAISSQHQLLAAAAAAAGQHQHQQITSGPPPPPPAASGSHHGHGGGAGGAHHHHHGHGHSSGGAHQPAGMQAHQFHPPAVMANGHGHAPAFQAPTQQQPQQQQQMMQQQHGPHAHHSGQISGQPGHHPLHAANTLAHHPHGGHAHGPHLASAVAAAAAAAAAHAANPSAAGPFGPNATLLAQLQQQQQHHHAHHPNQQNPNQTGSNTTQSSGNPQQTSSLAAAAANANSQQVGPASGNVAAAVAALAAAAAANSTASAGSNPPGSGGAGAAPPPQPAPNSSSLHLQSLLQQASSASSQPATGSSNQQSSNNNQQPASSSSAAAASATASTSFITGGGGGGSSATVAPPQLPPPPPAHVVAAVAAAAASPAQSRPQATTGSGGNQARQQQQPPPPPHSNPLLFNLKSSNNQPAATSGGGGAASGNAQQNQAPARFTLAKF